MNGQAVAPRQRSAGGMLGWRWWVLAGTLLLGACGGGGGSSSPVVAPVIDTQPQDVTVADGQAATFSVAAQGGDLSYQWRRNGADIAGANASSLQLAAVKFDDTGAGLSVVVSNSAGSATSRTATLTVTPVIPTISAQPQAVSVVVGARATFSVTARGTLQIGYQWLRDGAEIAGATAASYTTPTTVLADDGALFSVRLTNVAGSVTSAAAALGVTAQPEAPQITTQPQNASVSAGQTATFTVVATGTAPLAYQWRRNDVPVAGATQASYTTPAATSADNGASFTVEVSNSAGAIVSNAATLTVTAAPPSSGQRRLVIGSEHVVAVRADGSVIAWGDAGNKGLLGNGAPVAGTTARVVNTTAVSVAAGLRESIALGSDGIVRGWGQQTASTLFGGEVPASGFSLVSTPVTSTYPGGMVSIAASTQSSIGLRNDGTVWFLPGDAVTVGIGRLRIDARQVPGLTGVRSLNTSDSPAGNRTVAVKSDGTVWQITFASSGLFSWSATAAQVGGLSNIRSASCSALHCLALANDGTVWAWGSNLFGQLGNNSTTDSLIPVRVSGLSGVIAITAALATSHAITSDGQLWNWGSGGLSGLPNPKGDLLVPTALPGFNNVVEVAAGNSVLVRRADGSVWGWGRNLFGELATGNTTDSPTPIHAVGIRLD